MQKFILAMIAFLFCAISLAQSPYYFETHEGRVLGTMNSDGSLFFPNIPYAQPPVGELRWKAPRPPLVRSQDWDGRYLQIKSAQVASLFSGISSAEELGRPMGSEDSLYLNIWVPQSESTAESQKNKTRPVFVFFHGGSNKQGYASDPLYDGAELAKKTDAIVITVNYRLEAFGAFHHPALRSADPKDSSGNFVTLDGIEALKWIRANVPQLGGDIDRVTIAGESAGGVNVWGLLQSPLAKGLFANAYVSSGFPNSYPAAMAEYSANNFIQQALVLKGYAADKSDAKSVLAKMSRPEIKNFLYSLSTEDILKIPPSSVPIQHIADGHVLPIGGLATHAFGLASRVPMLVSTNFDEGTYFFAQSSMGLTEQEFWKQATGRKAPTAFTDLVQSSKFADFKSKANNLSKAFNQLVDSTLFPIQLEKPIYRMRWGLKPLKEPFRKLFGATHALDLFALFRPKSISKNHLFAFMNEDLQNPEFIKRSDLFLSYLKGFIHHGNPNAFQHGANAGPRWNAWNSIDIWTALNPFWRKSMDFTDSGVEENRHLIRPVTGYLRLIRSIYEMMAAGKKNTNTQKVFLETKAKEAQVLKPQILVPSPIQSRSCKSLFSH